MTPRTSRILRLALAAAGAVLALAIAAFVWWGLTPLGPSSRALAALDSDSAVTVTETEAGWTFTPSSGEATAGFIFYPGGHVDARSYAPYARDVAERGYVAIVPVMPLSLAVLSPNKAAKGIDAYPEIEHWVLGGHSLGGVMAAQFAGKNPAQAQGLVLLASYPSGGTDLSDGELTVASLVGTQDTVVDMATWEEARRLLPAQTRFDLLEGGNHAQFGDYGEQPGDTPDPDMTAEDQRASAVKATLEVLRGE